MKAIGVRSMRSGSTADHWQRVYDSKSPEEVGWYQSDHTSSMELIRDSGTDREGIVINVGCGASTILESLIAEGFSNLIAVDISATALSHCEHRLGEQVTWVVDDVTQPHNLLQLGEVNLWHDRAVLHFFTSEEEMRGYLHTLKTMLSVGGHAVIETFSLDGAPQCSGLDLRRYDEKMLCELLGKEFRLIRSIHHVHTTPDGGIRPYISTLFQRISVADR